MVWLLNFWLMFSGMTSEVDLYKLGNCMQRNPQAIELGVEYKTELGRVFISGSGNATIDMDNAFQYGIYWNPKQLSSVFKIEAGYKITDNLFASVYWRHGCYHPIQTYYLWTAGYHPTSEGWETSYGIKIEMQIGSGK
jgi:hypothetical protein